MTILCFVSAGFLSGVGIGAGYQLWKEYKYHSDKTTERRAGTVPLPFFIPFAIMFGIIGGVVGSFLGLIAGILIQRINL